MCGIFGEIGNCPIHKPVAKGTLSIKHRGTDSATFYSFERPVINTRIEGNARRLTDILEQQTPVEMGGSWVRYRTTGSTGMENSQPFLNADKSIALFENGQVKNMEAVQSFLLENGIVPESTSDAELLLHLFDKSFREANGSIDDRVFSAVKSVQERAIGAYSCLVMIKNQGLLAFTDPHGFRPMAIGERKNNSTKEIAFASETRPLTEGEYTNIREMTNGEAIFVHTDFSITNKILLQRPRTFCFKEIAYFSNKDSLFLDRKIEYWRGKLGEKVAQYIPKDILEIANQVTPIPNSAIPAAMGVSRATGIPYVPAIIKDDEYIRTFIEKTQELRISQIKKVLMYNPHIRDKNIILVDDTLIRGTVTKEVIQTLRNLGVGQVHMVIAAPPTIYDCDDYGMYIKHNMDKLIAKGKTIEQVKKEINADSLYYLQPHDPYDVIDKNLCLGCINGKYPTTPWE